MKIIAIYDSKGYCYKWPAIVQDTGIGVREFARAINNPQSEFFGYEADFTLFEIAEFDQSTGKVEPLQVPINLGNGVTFKKEVVKDA